MNFMEQYEIENDIPTFYVEADSFPEGIKAAWQKLHEIVKDNNRQFYGLSQATKDGKIIYRAATAETTAGEKEKYGCPGYTIRKGKYLSKTIHDFMQHIPEIGQTFQQMLKEDIDPEGCCVEWYENPKDVRCLARLKQ
jgi:predicted transcriptional regulator YdeE